MYIIRIKDHYDDAAFHRQEIENIMADLGWRGVNNKPATALILLHDTWIFYSSKDGIIYLNREELVTNQGTDIFRNSTIPPLPEVQYQRDIKRKSEYEVGNYRYYRSEAILASEEQERYVLYIVERVKARNFYLSAAFSAEILISFGITVATMDFVSCILNSAALPTFCLLWPTLLAACATVTTPSLTSADKSLAEQFHEQIDPSIVLSWETLQDPSEILDPSSEEEEDEEEEEAEEDEESLNCGALLHSFFFAKKEKPKTVPFKPTASLG